MLLLYYLQPGLATCSSLIAGAAFTMSDAELVSEPELLCPTDADQEVSVSDLSEKPLTVPKVDKEEKEEKEEEKKDKDVVEDVGSDEQELVKKELVKKVQEMSVAAVDDEVDFGHDALEATSSAEAELAPEPLKKPASSLPALPADSSVLEVPMDSSLPDPSPPRRLCPLLLDTIVAFW